MLFGVKYGFILLIFSSVSGATCLYFTANFFFRNLIIRYFAEKYQNQINFIKKNQFIYFVFLRVIPGIPYQVLNLLPVFINMKIYVYFLATLIGTALPKFLIVSVAGGLAKNLNNSQNVDSSVFLSYN